MYFECRLNAGIGFPYVMVVLYKVHPGGRCAIRVNFVQNQSRSIVNVGYLTNLKAVMNALRLLTPSRTSGIRRPTHFFASKKEGENLGKRDWSIIY